MTTEITSESVTVEQLNTLAQKIADLRVEEAKCAFVKKAAMDKLEEAENEMVGLLIESGLKSYRAPAGNCVLTYRTSVKTPKTPEEKAAFYDYLKSKGLFDAMITVNSATLNSFYREEAEVAAQKGEVLEVPGITEVTTTPILSFRK